MKYKRLNFEDYFTICSDNYNKLETDLELAVYKDVPYEYKGKTFYANYQVRYDSKRNCIQAIFQQTYQKSDGIVNFDFPKKVYDQFTFDGKLIQLRAHGGWVRMWLVIQDMVRDDIKDLLLKHPKAFVEVFGWSLGSGIAQLAAEDIYFKFGIKPYLYTYGSVKPFFGKRTWKYVSTCCEEVYNFKFKEDIVGYMVPFFGWHSINSIKIKGEKHFCLFNLFKPNKYHTIYDTEGLYDDLR